MGAQTENRYRWPGSNDCCCSV